MQTLRNNLFSIVLAVTMGSVGFSFSVDSKSHAAVDSIQKADYLLEHDQEAAALDCLNRLIDVNPKNALAYSQRAMIYAKRYRDAEATSDANKAVSLASKDARVYANRAAALLRTQDSQKALDDIRKALIFKPGYAYAYSARAKVFEKVKAYPRELEEINKAIVLEPRNAQFYLDRAAAYRHLEQFDRAVQDCNKASLLSLNDSEVHLERGLILWWRRMSRAAINELSTAIKMAPNSIDALLSRARCYTTIGQYPKSLADFNKVIEINPKVIAAYEGRAYVLYGLGRQQNVIADTAMVSSLGEPSIGCLSNAALANYELGNYDKSLALLNKILNYYPNQLVALQDRANVYYKLGKPDLARDDLRKAYRAADAEKRSSLGCCYPFVDFTKDVDCEQQESVSMQVREHPVVLPFGYSCSRHLVVPLEIDSQKLKAIFSTGCSHTVLWKHSAADVVTTGDAVFSEDLAAGDKFVNALFKPRSFKLGSMALIYPAINFWHGPSKLNSLSGLIGGNFIENFVVKIDYVKNQITLTSKVEQKSADAIVVPIWIRKHVPFCAVRLNGTLPVAGMLDTGNTSSLAPDSLLESLLPPKLEYNNHTNCPWSGEANTASIKLQTLELAGHKVKPPIFDVFRAHDLPLGANEITLGNDFLSQFKSVTIDYPGRQVIFEPGNNSISALTCYREAQYLTEHHQWQKALGAFNEAMSLDSSLTATCHYQRALILADVKQYQAAISEFSQAISSNYEPLESCYHHRAHAFDNLQQSQKAVEDWSEAIRLKPQSPWYYHDRAESYLKLNSYKLSIADNTKALQLDPKFVEAYTDRALAYEKLGQKALAERDRAKVQLLNKK